MEKQCDNFLDEQQNDACFNVVMYWNICFGHSGFSSDEQRKERVL